MFVVDRQGRTVGVTHWSDAPTDVEALAPAGPGAVWVGDIGDNLGHRPDVTITRVPVGRGDRTVHATSYRLSYPGARRTPRPWSATPAPDGSTSPARASSVARSTPSPVHLRADRVNPLTRIGRVLPMATDGAFFPDGSHLVVRGYFTATVYAWPSLQPWRLRPARAAAGRRHRGGRGRVGVPLLGGRSIAGAPDRPARRRTTGDQPHGEPSSSPSSTRTSRPSFRARAGGDTDVWPWVLGGLVGLVALVLLLRSLRPR